VFKDLKFLVAELSVAILSHFQNESDSHGVKPENQHTDFSTVRLFKYTLSGKSMD
jgi:hypothetical protein